MSSQCHAFFWVAWLLMASCARAEDWPQFRGSTGQGHSQETKLPVTWSETQNIAWRTPIAGLGWSSPVVCGEQVWVTTSVEEEGTLCAVALHRESGEVMHEIEVFRKDDLGRINAKNTHASPTPVVEGDRVYVHYGSHGTACLTTNGQVVWRTELAYNQHHGPGASPVVWRGLLIVSCDGVDQQYVVALDKRSGRQVWRQERAGKNAYSSPLIIEEAGRELLVAACGDGVWAYDPASGREMWRFAYEGHSVNPTPVYRDGLLYVCSGYWTPALYAVRVDGHGDITATHQVFAIRRGVPFTPSPLLMGTRLFLLSDRGVGTAIDAQSGSEVWTQRFGGNFSASPVAADGRIYVLSEDATTTVFAAADEFQQLAVNQLPGRALASPAISQGAIFIRTDEAVWCIREQSRAPGRSLASNFEIMDAPPHQQATIRR